MSQTGSKAERQLLCPHTRLAPVKWRGIASLDRLFFELGGAEVVERGMAPNGVIKGNDASSNVALGFCAGEECCSPNQFRFQRLDPKDGEANNVSTIALL